MPTSAAIWVIDDDRSIRWVLEKALAQAGLQAHFFASADPVFERLAREVPQVIISDVRMPGADGINLLAHVKSAHPQVSMIIMTAHADLDSAIQSYQGGAFEYLPKPFDVGEAIALIRRALANADQGAPGAHPAVAFQEDGLIGRAAAMQAVFRTIGRLAQSNITVLINGESGTGKELVARALHRHSPRGRAPFIALNMGAIPRDLIESELFGHEKGAFTGATAMRKGSFEQAGGGTLFLDEIGDMPLEAQTRLLRVLAEGHFHRVGGIASIRADVRIIAATHQNLEALVSQGRFREDLFYRLNVVRIRLPPLSERREDIPGLAAFFLHQAARDLGIEPRILSPAAEQHLTQWRWPGNVRQLENVCRWITVMAASREVHVGDLPHEMQQAAAAAAPGEPTAWEDALDQWASRALADGAGDLLQEALPAFERIMIAAALRHTAGGRRDAARLLGWGRNTLTRKIKELGMEAAAADHADDEDSAGLSPPG